MLLQDKETGTLVEINDLQALISPNQDSVTVQDQSGQEEQDPEPLKKSNLIFPSGESLPRCWVDADYQK
ncbi:hypothetical protein RIVM261_080610 [Rivularia sp. IAM M-261]|nr:hypothetical protein CAL7716_016430 [Calothrix sp. PCC 7716]GJD23105.1 hypothetical protein RIVM261_080610 [Rivularia sp. IAM M-261]